MEKRCTAETRSGDCRVILMKSNNCFPFLLFLFCGIFFSFSSPHDSLLSASMKLISQKESQNIHFYLFRLFYLLLFTGEF